MIQFRSMGHGGRDSMSGKKIKCPNVTELLSDFIDGQLGAADRQAVETHLDACPDCHQVYDELLRTISLLKRLPKHVPSTTATNPQASDESD